MSTAAVRTSVLVAVLLLAGCVSGANAAASTASSAAVGSPALASSASVFRGSPAPGRGSGSPAGSSRSPRPPTGSSARSAAKPSPTDMDAQTAHNKSAAAAEAQRLARLVQLPPHSTPANPEPDKLPPAAGAPISIAPISITSYHRIPLDQIATMRWLARHPPTGLGSGTGEQKSFQGGKLMTFGTNFESVVPSPAVSYAGVAINSLALSPSTTLVRVDAVAEWTDPRPMPDTASGRRVSLTVAGGCPHSDQHIAGVDGTGASTTSLLPTDTPVSGLVCTYRGGNAQAYQLAGSAVLDAKAADRLSGAIAALPLSKGRGIRTCPGGDGAADLIALRYQDGSTTDLFLTTNGCTDMSNGRIVADSVDVDALHLGVTPR